MRYLHTMVRVSNLEASLDFYCNKLGLKQVRRVDHEAGRFTLVFVAAPGQEDCAIELTHNWDPEQYAGGRNFGHVAYEVDDIYAFASACATPASRSIARRATARWLSSDRRTISRSSCCRKAPRCRRLSPGRRCRTRERGRC